MSGQPRSKLDEGNLNQSRQRNKIASPGSVRNQSPPAKNMKIQSLKKKSSPNLSLAEVVVLVSSLN